MATITPLTFPNASRWKQFHDVVYGLGKKNTNAQGGLSCVELGGKPLVSNLFWSSTKK